MIAFGIVENAIREESKTRKLDTNRQYSMVGIFLRKNEVRYGSERDRRTEKGNRIARVHGC